MGFSSGSEDVILQRISFCSTLIDISLTVSSWKILIMRPNTFKKSKSCLILKFSRMYCLKNGKTFPASIESICLINAGLWFFNRNSDRFLSCVWWYLSIIWWLKSIYKNLVHRSFSIWLTKTGFISYFFMITSTLYFVSLSNIGTSTSLKSLWLYLQKLRAIYLYASALKERLQIFTCSQCRSISQIASSYSTYFACITSTIFKLIFLWATSCASSAFVYLMSSNAEKYFCL